MCKFKKIIKKKAYQTRTFIIFVGIQVPRKIRRPRVQISAAIFVTESILASPVAEPVARIKVLELVELEVDVAESVVDVLLSQQFLVLFSAVLARCR